MHLLTSAGAPPAAAAPGSASASGAPFDLKESFSPPPRRPPLLFLPLPRAGAAAAALPLSTGLRLKSGNVRGRCRLPPPLLVVPSRAGMLCFVFCFLLTRVRVLISLLCTARFYLSSFYLSQQEHTDFLKIKNQNQPARLASLVVHTFRRLPVQQYLSMCRTATPWLRSLRLPLAKRCKTARVAEKTVAWCRALLLFAP